MFGVHIPPMSNVINMSNRAPSMKIRVQLETRPDGGLRAWSEDVPGFVLSHPNRDAVISDVPMALSTILSAYLDSPVDIELLVSVRSFLDGDMGPPESTAVETQEYVARCA